MRSFARVVVGVWACYERSVCMSNVHQLPPRKPEKRESRAYKDTPRETNWGCLAVSVYFLVALGALSYWVGIPILRWIIKVLR